MARSTFSTVSFPRYMAPASQIPLHGQRNSRRYLHHCRHHQRMDRNVANTYGGAFGLLSLLRNEGGCVGTSMVQTVQERRLQFHSLPLGEYLDPFNAAAQSFIAQARALFQTSDPGCFAAAGPTGTRERAPAASIRPGLFRCLLVAGRRDACARAHGAADETLGG
jgi:hypothetical protein